MDQWRWIVLVASSGGVEALRACLMRIYIVIVMNHDDDDDDGDDVLVLS